MNMENEVIAKKSTHIFTLWIVLGIILIVLSAVSLVGFIMDGFDVYFLFMCVLMGVCGSISIVNGTRNKKLPLELIIANDEGFGIITTKTLIPYQAVHSVEAKYYNRRIIITTQNGYKYAVHYVANYQEVKLNIAKKVKEKTGQDIVVL